MYVCMYKDNLALNNLLWLICHKTKLKQTNLDNNSFISFCGSIIITVFQIYGTISYSPTICVLHK